MPEILAPAGDLKALKNAVNNGADAVYLSGINYGARAYAPNFNNEELKEAINYAHIHNVKIYVTVNTLIFEKEIDEFLKYIKYLYEIGTDALIIQDLGMIKLIKKLIPSFELHASTQCHICNDYALAFLKKIGIKRAVLARELNINQIKSLKTDVEKEIFAYGALCICYSGCCLMSFNEGGRSANRGKCAGPCRLKYSLIMDNKTIIKDKYLLSTRELNTSPKLKDIIKCNIQSLKIEGRMKNAEYTGYVTKIFKNLINNNIDNYEDNLKKLFNRKFTLGHLYKDKIVNNINPGHLGLYAGDIINTNKFIKIKLIKDIAQNDGIKLLPSGKGMIINKLYDKNKCLINKASKGDIIYLENKINSTNDKTINITLDNNLLKSLNSAEIKEEINYKVIAKINNPLIIKINYQNITATYKGNKVIKAKTSPITKENIIYHLSKLGDYPFKVNNFDIKINGNIFIPVKELNKAKRFLAESIINEKLKVNRKCNINYHKHKISHNTNLHISAYISNENQLKYLINKIDIIYTDNYDLYKKYKSNKIYYKLKRNEFHLKEYSNENLLISEIGSLYKYYKNNNIICDYPLNITNSFSANLINEYNAKLINASIECNNENLKEMLKYTNNIELLVYGHVENMITNYCLIKDNLGCEYCKHNFKLKRNNKEYQIINNNCQNKILSSYPINRIKDINYYKSIGISSIRFDFYNETINEIKDILNEKIIE